MTYFLISAVYFLGILLMYASSADAAAFLHQNTAGISARAGYKQSPSASSHALRMVPESSEVGAAAFSNFNNFLLATIDSDIASVPDNEFAPIFAGGVLVMFGGVLSALVVGFILDSRDLYAQVVADSYAAQGTEDEEFWKGLSEEEKKKTQELLAKMKESKDGALAPSMVMEAKDELGGGESKEETSTSKNNEAATQTASGKDKDVGMFSDY